MKDIKVNYEVDVNEIIYGDEYRRLDSGASKIGFLDIKNKTVIKVPVAADEIYSKLPMYEPESNAEIDDLLDKVAHHEDRYCWAYGQFATEIFVWNKLLELEKEGYDISCFARIKDYYVDEKNIPVIEQEYAGELIVCCNDEADLYNTMLEEMKPIREELKNRWDIDLKDIREGNCGVLNGKCVCFDFGISSNTIYNYDSYDDDEYDSYDSYDSYENSYEG